MKLWRALISLELCLVLLALVAVCMSLGSFSLGGEYAVTINGMALFAWLRETPLFFSWWIWATLVLLVLLTLNTVLCSSDTLWMRWGRGGWTALLAPQLMHAGFLLIVLAHLLSAIGSSIHSFEVREKSLAALPDGTQYGISSIAVTTSSQGMPLAFSSELVTNLNNPDSRVIISPNHPWFLNGYGVYIKQAEAYPIKRALFEIHREPGAMPALAGALLFTVGNVLLVVVRSRVRENERCVSESIS
ncbi:MAG: cytochrome C biogenesis protein ResB [Desulfuromonadaceae bacterium]|nr:cytochrome C biogenesis protein ResB [Desulfuromonadaceae bacterium]MDD5107680.1 cytochrome C biogenesis protein ResB [Desulfuromonadaceae bacterium]